MPNRALPAPPRHLRTNGPKKGVLGRETDVVRMPVALPIIVDNGPLTGVTADRPIRQARVDDYKK